MSEIGSSELLDDGVSDAPPVTKNRRVGHLVMEWGIILVVALLVSVALRTYAFQTFFIPSGSMEPTLQIGDRIVVDKLAVDWGTIHRGDILVFKAPPSENCGGTPVTDLVKRVVGIPGDHIYSVGNTIYVNGAKFNENWTHTEPLGSPIATQNNPIVVAPHHYFMMGDNHADSCDSRMWGTIPRSDVIGKAFFRVWPLTRLGFL
ncbi:MAG: signal peptidase I [Acidobacteriota bacterium]|nr:signal peptidase I [Acidobacteriota bacterium]MDE3030739.1 signal peptidase I [Acidobacteriota bacterium]